MSAASGAQTCVAGLAARLARGVWLRRFAAPGDGRAPRAHAAENACAAPAAALRTQIRIWRAI
jgi:hypothetical protein